MGQGSNRSLLSFLKEDNNVVCEPFLPEGDSADISPIVKGKF